MTEAEWLACTNPDVLLKGLGEVGYPERQGHLFGVACCRRLWDRFTTDKAKQIIELVEAILDETDKSAKSKKLKQLRSMEFGGGFRPLTGTPDQAVARLYRGLYSPLGFIHWPVVVEILGEVAEAARRSLGEPGQPAWNDESAAQAALARDIFSNHVRPVEFAPAWRTDTVTTRAQQMYDARDFSAMPILADALQDAGCTDERVLTHCRGAKPHCRGCWVIDAILQKK